MTLPPPPHPAAAPAAPTPDQPTGPSLPAAPTLPTLAASPTVVQSPHAVARSTTTDAPPATRYAAPAPVLPHIKTPSGLVIRKSIAPMIGTGVAGAVMLCTYLAVVAWSAKVALHFVEVDRFVTRVHDGLRRPSDEATAARLDHETAQYMLILGAAFLVGMVATAWWSRRVAMNVESIGDRETNVTLATWVWFIPIAWFFASFRLLRRVPRSDWPIASWQLPFVAPFIAAYIVWRAFGIAARVDRGDDGEISLGTFLGFAHAEKFISLMLAGFTFLALLGAAHTVLSFRRTFAEIEATRREATAA